ncbi:MAG: ATPase, T2SS/T4P/T4SS family [Bdellovibrionota bacterium]
MTEHHPLLKSAYLSMQEEVSRLDPYFSDSTTTDVLAKVFEKQTSQFTSEIRKRMWDEFFGEGPLVPLLSNNTITEIMVTNFNQIWFEGADGKSQLSDHFINMESYEKFVHRFCQDRNIPLSFDHPFAEFSFGEHRWTFIYSQVSRGKFQTCIRRKNTIPWSLSHLESTGFCTSAEREGLNQIIHQKQNYLVVGSTGSGKTTLLNSLLREIPGNERVVILEDTEELSPPNELSCALTSRKAVDQQFRAIDLHDLLKVSLRLRPDRLVVGEVRGGEAKDLLLALSSGHAGSFATLHADNPGQALLRLEMLVQMGAPQWSLDSIRRLIHLSIHGIIVVGIEKNKRKLQGIFRIQSLESTGFILEQYP